MSPGRPTLDGLRWEAADDPAAADIAAVDEGLDAFNRRAADLDAVRRAACFARDEAGRVVAGAVGRTWGTASELQQIWVREDLRGRGIGARLVRSFEDLVRNLERQIALAHLFGYTRIVMPWTALRSRSEITDMLRKLSRAAALLHEDGLALGYHNHEFEMDRWPDGGRILDLVLAETSLFLEPDLGWLWYAGEDPRAFLEHHGPRCPLVHVKEFARRGQRSFCPVGAGGVGYADLLPFLDELAPEAIILEQDESPDQPPLAACAQSIDFVRSALKLGSPTETT